MISIALAILLGHNFIGHHHHDKEQIAFDHSHADDHHQDNEGEDDEKDFDLSHILSHLPHEGSDVTFLKGQDYSKKQLKQLLPSVALVQPIFSFDYLLVFERQNAPPYKVVYFNSHYYLPSGLRAPPSFII